MIALTYIIKGDDLERELEWLRDDLKIYPAYERYYNFDKFLDIFYEIGMIVSPEDAVAIKFRKELKEQNDWSPK